MDWENIQDNWPQYKDHVKAQWSQLTYENLDVIAGKREQLLGRIQETYGVSWDDANKQIKSFQKYLKESLTSHPTLASSHSK